MFTVTNVLLLADVGEVCCGVTTGLVGAVGDVCVNITTFGAKGTSFEEFKSDPWFPTKFDDDVVLPIVVVVKLALGVKLDREVLVVWPSIRLSFVSSAPGWLCLMAFMRRL